MDRNRERKVIAAVACPDCGAARGQGCTLSANERVLARGRILVHGVRRAAWQAWKRSEPVAIRVVGSTMIADSLEAYRELDVRAPDHAVRDPVSRTVRLIILSEIEPLILELVAAGWRVE